MYSDQELSTSLMIFNALGNEVRLRILLMLTDTRRPLHIKAVAQNLKKEYSAVYRHVKILERAQLLRIHEVGRSRVLSLPYPQLIKQFIDASKEVSDKE